MYGSQRRLSSVVITDPGGDKSVPILRFDENTTIEAVYVCPDTTVAASTTAYYSIQLLDGGAVGTGSGTISSVIGGTAGWVANTQKAGTMVAGSSKLDADDWLVAKYAETGSVAPGRITVVVEYVVGVGDKAAA